MKRVCKARTERGEPCRQPPLLDSEYCFWHDPNHEKEAAEARRLGGARRRREGTLIAAYDIGELVSILDLRRLIQIAVLDTLGLENSIARNRTLGYLAQVGVGLLEKGELEERLAAIEAALGPRALSAKSRR